MRPYLRAFTMLLPVAVVLSGAVLVTTDSHDAPARDAALAAARPRGATTLLPQVVQQGTRVAAANRAYLAGQVKFYPTRKGRPVLIQRRVGTGAWNTVATRRQNGAGLVTFTAAAKTAGNKPYTYRGVAKRYNGEAAVAAAPQSAAVWQQQFLDEFKGTSLDPKTWSHRSTGEYIDSRTVSAGSPKSVSVKDGTLRMQVRRDPYRAGHYLNGHISTDGTFDFRFGVAAARVKFPKSQGQHGSFWMQPSLNDTTKGAEIDVVEYFGDGFAGGGLAHFLYPESTGEKIGGVVPAATRQLAGTDDWWKSYHVFSVEWTGKRYVFRVDGVETYRTGRAVSQEEEYLILSLLSSDWELSKLNLKTTPKQMQVDWVRVWKK